MLNGRIKKNEEKKESKIQQQDTSLNFDYVNKKKQNEKKTHHRGFRYPLV